MKATIQRSTLDDGLKPYNWTKFVQPGWLLSGGHRRCVLCGDHAGDIAMCDGCCADLPWRDRPWQKRLAGIDTIVACFEFGYPIRELLHRAKYGRDIAIACLLGELFVTRLRMLGHTPARPVALFPVPMARRRLLVRGYNQAIAIAEPISSVFTNIEDCRPSQNSMPRADERIFAARLLPEDNPASIPRSSLTT